MSLASIDQLSAQLTQIRREMRGIEDELSTLRRANITPNETLYVGRQAEPSDKTPPPSVVDPDRASDVDELAFVVLPGDGAIDPDTGLPFVPTGDLTKASGYRRIGITKMDRDARLQNYEQSTAYIRFQNRYFHLPVPGRLIPILVSRETIADPDPLFGWEGRWSDIIWPGTLIGTRAIPPSFEGPLPLLNVNDDGTFYGSPAKPPWRVGVTVVPAFHVWPLPDPDDPLRVAMLAAFAANGTGAPDPGKGFYITFTEPPGPEAVEFCDDVAIPAGGGTFHVTVKTDSTGRVTDIEFASGSC